MNEVKLSLRQSIRRQRENLSSDWCLAHAKSLAHLLIAEPYIQNSTRLAYYWPVANEMDPRPFIQLLSHKLTYLPTLKAGSRELLFYPYQMGEPLKLNPFKIPEPAIQTHNLAATELDAVIVPLIGFDLSGNRLGTGGGYYDYTFNFLQDNPEKRPILIGIGYEFQKIAHLSPEPWDIKLDKVVTEQRIYDFSNLSKE